MRDSLRELNLARANQFFSATVFVLSVLIPCISHSQDTIQAQGLLKYPLTSEDKSRIRREVAACFEIEMSISFGFDVGDIYPDKQFRSEVSASLKFAEELKKKFQKNPDDFNTCLAVSDAYRKLHKMEETDLFLEKSESLAKNKLVKNPK